MDLNPAGDGGSNYFDKVLSMLSFAYNKERATNSSPFIDSILHNAHFLVFFAVYLICRYVNHISLYQALVCVGLTPLWGVFLDKDGPLIHWMDKLIKLRKLGLAFQLSLEEQKPLADKIVKLKSLQSLRMRSIDEMGEPSDLVCVRLSGLESLSCLNLFGKLDRSMIDAFPKNLTDLTLSGASLSENSMPVLEKLSNLKFLSFYSNSYTGSKMVCSTTGFPKLVVLKLWKLQQLVDWDVQEKAMQNLRELEIRACTYLKVPSGLRHLKNLTQLKLTNMPEEFAATIAITKAQIWDDITHLPAVIIDTW